MRPWLTCLDVDGLCNSDVVDSLFLPVVDGLNQCISCWGTDSPFKHCKNQNPRKVNKHYSSSAVTVTTYYCSYYCLQVKRFHAGRRAVVRGGAGAVGQAELDGEQRPRQAGAADVHPRPAHGALRHQRALAHRHDRPLRVF
ncbi:uncharacterized protein LOC123424668 isoform X3 [Hordeum vulgare subsp. vulgare]|uniref:uncharacterized protein LOC123424668 isoform X3 n=1 Tax=Hordeum vulgare subsp. vulgare TaxID=112509 RepID=UPI001D1A42BD|nr:uncharacterized protein LOC123424668 isoform X3 [Hordeum vulgare subsp. vulgare]